MALRTKRNDDYVINFEPRVITLDCYGTLTNFRMGAVTRELVADLVSTDRMDAFVDDIEAQRLDEVLGPWKPYPEVGKTVVPDDPRAVESGVSRGGRPGTCRRRTHVGPAPRRAGCPPALASRYPLAILSNASDDQIAPVRSVAPARTLIRAATSSRLEHDEGESR